MRWQPSADILAIKQRAKLLAQIRDFFAKCDVLEVETPLLAKYAVTDPHIEALVVENSFLQTSPEYAMKRLLAAGIGDIYQICKAFRGKEQGSQHNIEFTILEWYRVGIDYKQLMQEVDQLLQTTLNLQPANIVSYQQLFMQYLQFNPHTISLAKLQEHTTINIDASNVMLSNMTKADYLELLFDRVIAKNLVGNKAWIVYDYTKEQAALAKLRKEGSVLHAERFEVYVQGVELANGYHELQDHNEQLHRLQRDQQRRKELNSKQMIIDERFIAALKYGLPHCSGVAVGVDRLLMLQLGKAEIGQVLSFTGDCA